MSEWEALRRATAARIGLARAGGSLATAPLLSFRLAQARARDAVHDTLDGPALAAVLPSPALIVSSQASDRHTYLMRPDLGRMLTEADTASLRLRSGEYDLAVMIGDGLSATAVMRHAPPLVRALQTGLAAWTVAPLVIARQARVALGDRVAAVLGAAAVLVLIGERPGLSAPDSLGAYLTWAPGPATTDAGRNCVSNIRPDGLGYAEAARTLLYLLDRMRALRLSGVALKDESRAGLLPP